MLPQYREVVAADFEFVATAGDRPVPVCLVAHELKSGRRFRLWQQEMGSSPPYAHGPDTLFVAYAAPAELGCYRALGWSMPPRVLDLYVEFRRQTNGLKLPVKNSLLGALTYHQLDGIGATEKRDLQHAIGTDTWQGRYTKDEILDYCESDVEALKRLLPEMLPRIDMPRAVLRGRYMAAASAMEHNGIPIDTDTLAAFRAHWGDIQDDLIAEINANYDVYDGRTFRTARFAAWLEANRIPWPRLESGELDLKERTFREMARVYPEVSPLRELRSSLAELRLNNLAVGRDGRNRTSLWGFSSKTGRNQPSNSEYIFGPSVWLRGLIKPPPGHGVAYIDWSQQEFGIAAALSGDPAMQAAYMSGDPYLEFAKQAGAVPKDATKQSHSTQRDLYKACVLAVGYGMGWQSLADRIGQQPIVSRDLLAAYWNTYPRFKLWSDAAVDHAMLHSWIDTVFGWRLHRGDEPNPRSLRNYPMQANGSEMLRLACCFATEAGVKVCAPVHDAMLIEAPLDRLDHDIARMQAAMAEASRAVLGGFELRSDVKVVRYPDRYMDEARGRAMWNRVVGLINNINAGREGMRA
jgi:hypothetical protein